MNTPKIFLTASLITLVTLSAVGQDERYAQSYANPLRINPSIMGLNRDIKVGLNYRSQFGTIEKGYKTYGLTAMYPIVLKDNNGKVDIGVTASSDKAGAFSTTDLQLAVDYNYEMSPNNNLCLAVMGGYIQKKIDVAGQSFDYQYVNGAYSATNPTGETTPSDATSMPDIGFGFLWSYNPNKKESRVNAFVGFSGYHLNQPAANFTETEAKLPMKFSYQAGLRIRGNAKVDLCPQFRTTNQNGNVEPAGGLYMNYHFNPKLDFVIGGWYRSHDANCIVVGFEHEHYTLGYSYDMINGGLNNARNDVKAHEITLSIKLNKGPKAKEDPDEIEKEILKGVKNYSHPVPAF